MKRHLIVICFAGLLHGCAAALNPSKSDSSAPAPDFMPQLLEIARRVLAQPYVAPDETLPPEVSKLNYDQHRAFAFNEDKALWRKTDLPFELQFYPRGWLFKREVELNLIRRDGVLEPLRFSPDQFTHMHDKNLRLPQGLGYAGWRALAFLNPVGRRDEMIALLGASYYRALGSNQVYGSSARGLAIDVATDHEEFPMNRRFWIRQSTAGDKALVFYTLLDSPSVVGAYRYSVESGADTVVTIDATLLARKDVAKLCVAPITSMFLYGKRSDRVFPDFRPEIHDADVLLIHDAAGKDKWTARPLNNPRQPRTIDHPVQSLRGFGLLQRERDFHCYQDLEAAYDRRPSAWVEPIGDWGSGHIELFELSSDLEYNDNINAYFIPAEPMKAGQSRSFRYRLHWLAGDPPKLELARVVGAWRQPMKESADGREGKWLPAVRYLIDFAGPELAKMTPVKPPQLWIDAGKAKVLGARAEPNPHTGGWRLVFEVDPLDQMTVDLRAGFAWNDAPLSETWTERWSR